VIYCRIFMLKRAAVRTAIAISLGAIAGALGRYYVWLGLSSVLDPKLPYSTLIINLSGCFAMGLVSSLLGSAGGFGEIRLLLTTGFLGSYTTFSAYQLDSIRLLDQNQIGAALLYWSGSLGFGCLSLVLGTALAHWLQAQQARSR
jgi:fluoride exporter